MSNKINIHNYQAFLLDWMEGNLSNEEGALLKEFLQQHPEISVDENLLKEPILLGNSIVFKQKENLKKTITEDDLIAYHEGDLSALQKNDVEVFAATNTSLKKDFALYAKLKLQPEVIVFEHKHLLKKKGVVISFKRIIYTASSVAALWLVFMFLFAPSRQYNPRNKIASQSSFESTLEADDFDFLQPKKLEVDHYKTPSKHNAPKHNIEFLLTDNNIEKTEKENVELDSIISQKNDYSLAFLEQENSYGAIIIRESEEIKKPSKTKKFTVKQYLISKIKNNILKVKDDNETQFEVDDFTGVLASISNDKIMLMKKDGEDYINVHTRYFSFNKKISN